MTAREFACLVREMRAAQKRFFGGDRSSETLRHTKDLERRVDRAAEDLFDDRPSLFAKEAP